VVTHPVRCVSCPRLVVGVCTPCVCRLPSAVCRCALRHRQNADPRVLCFLFLFLAFVLFSLFCFLQPWRGALVCLSLSCYCTRLEPPARALVGSVDPVCPGLTAPGALPLAQRLRLPPGPTTVVALKRRLQQAEAQVAGEPWRGGQARVAGVSGAVAQANALA